VEVRRMLPSGAEVAVGKLDDNGVEVTIVDLFID
jgi:hypothetical protein